MRLPYAFNGRVGQDLRLDTALQANFAAIERLLTDVFACRAGVVEWFGGASADIPSNALLADGSAVSRTTYAKLFAAIGTAHGAGDGSTTFNLPDARERFLLGIGASLTTLGGTGGVSSVTLTTTELPAHSHTISVTDPGHTHGGVTGSNTANFTSNAATTITDPGHSHGGATSADKAVIAVSATVTITDPGHAHGGATGSNTANFTSTVSAPSATTGITASTDSKTPTITVTDPGHTHGGATGGNTANFTGSATSGTESADHTHDFTYGTISNTTVTGAGARVTSVATTGLGNTLTSQGKSATHTHSTSATNLNSAQGNHTHTISSGTTGITASAASTGSGAAFSVRNPYILGHWIIWTGEMPV